MKPLSILGINRTAGRRGLCWWKYGCLLIGVLAMGYGEDVAKAEAISAAPTGESINRNLSMSVAEARKVLTQLWENQKPDRPSYQYDKLSVTFIGKEKVELYMSLISTNWGSVFYNYRVNLTEMSDPYIKTRDFWNNFNGFKVVLDRGVTYETNTAHKEGVPIIWPLKSEAEAFCTALSVLKQNAIKEKTKVTSESSSFADFQEKARAWRALKVKPDLPQDVRRFRVLAEDAIKHQEFEKAIQYYEQGLEIEPLWPQGQYNAALLYGEMKEYRDAELHMKRYLELVPDAPDAQAARDQMMIWQSRMKQ
jgi:tetratricopeptide (TPR) repeat protein